METYTHSVYIQQQHKWNAEGKKKKKSRQETWVMWNNWQRMWILMLPTIQSVRIKKRKRTSQVKVDLQWTIIETCQQHQQHHARFSRHWEIVTSTTCRESRQRKIETYKRPIRTDWRQQRPMNTGGFKPTNGSVKRFWGQGRLRPSGPFRNQQGTINTEPSNRLRDADVGKKRKKKQWAKMN